MMWRSHFIIGATLPIIVGDYGGAVAAVIGSVAPDYLEELPRVWGGRKIAHRTTTHVMVYWIAAVLVLMSLASWSTLPMWWAWGGLSHVLADSLTPMGVPIFPTQKHRTNFLGGAIRSGSAGEYVIMAVCVVFATLAFRFSGTDETRGFMPFFPDYFKKYDEGVIDAHELKENRFRWF